MLLIAVLLHIFLDDLAVLFFGILLRHAFQLLPGAVLVLPDEVEEAGLGYVDVAHCGLFEIAVDLETFIGLQKDYSGLLGVVF